MADLLQLAAEAEAKIVRRLLRPASRPAPYRAEVGVVVDYDVNESQSGVLDFATEADDVYGVGPDVLHGHQTSQIAGQVA